ncbi:cytochrome P450 [Deinococcus cellulosilyticus]|uniref:Cytochrome P450 n=1 Tax=Deinococcus cellulosilyticus (strain DSM 18568 / NBRC 106333 / KACC 11606 / 5516J-15) TaxID=1223518 RepID=A0A511N362_DEIC1|nr:cytochrome P450 [Deinococcus cellulosilyticus]GEM46937.1 hypothetical protein DC3_25720 [Deinococcus cellulosilyticus NBRC 106333 = KACC 11606]
MSFPAHPIAAVTHPDPRVYHEALLKGPPVHFDSTLQVWVVTHPEAIVEALNHPDLRVRPPHEPVPTPLLGTPLEPFFRSLLRMNDGEMHQTLRPLVLELLESISEMEVQEATRSRLSGLSLQNPNWAFHLGLEGLRSLLRVPEDLLTTLSAACLSLVFSLSPLAGSDDVKEGIHALHTLEDILQRSPLAQQNTTNPRVWRSNLIGLLVQTCDATAGLLGLSLLALKKHPELQTDLRSGKMTLQDVVLQAARHGCPVQNTRRFAARDITLYGHTLPAGSALLLLLGTASVHPSAPLLTFGAGPHHCPGENLAITLVTAALQALLEQGMQPEHFSCVGYRPSINTRVPLLQYSKEPK